MNLIFFPPQKTGSAYVQPTALSQVGKEGFHALCRLGVVCYYIGAAKLAYTVSVYVSDTSIKEGVQGQ